MHTSTSNGCSSSSGIDPNRSPKLKTTLSSSMQPRTGCRLGSFSPTGERALPSLTLNPGSPYPIDTSGNPQVQPQGDRTECPGQACLPLLPTFLGGLASGALSSLGSRPFPRRLPSPTCIRGGTERRAAEGAEEAVGGILRLLSQQHMLVLWLTGQCEQLVPPGEKVQQLMSCPLSSCLPNSWTTEPSH